MIIGAVPRTIKNRRAVDKAYAAARREIVLMLKAASERKAKRI